MENYKKYLESKVKYNDVVLLVENDDFYETYDDDAKILNQLFNSTLINRKTIEDKEFLICGFHKNSIDVYLTRLVKNGNKVGLVKF